METIPEEDVKEIIDFNSSNPELEKMLIQSNSPPPEENPILERLGRFGQRNSEGNEELRDMRRRWWKKRLLESGHLNSSQQNDTTKTQSGDSNIAPTQNDNTLTFPGLPTGTETNIPDSLTTNVPINVPTGLINSATSLLTTFSPDSFKQKEPSAPELFEIPKDPNTRTFVSNIPNETNTNFDDFWGNSVWNQQKKDSFESHRRQQTYSDLYNDEPVDDDEFDRKTCCVICRVKFYPYDETTILPCSHKFHTNELKQWLEINNSCPSCGFAVESDMDVMDCDTDMDAEPWKQNPMEYNLMKNLSDEDVLDDSNFNNTIELLCRVYSKRDQKGMVFFVLKYHSHMIQALVFKKSVAVKIPNIVNGDVNNMLGQITNQSVVKITGKLVQSPVPIKSTEVSYTDREIHIEEIELVSKSEVLPIQISDLNWTSDVGQDVCLNNRVLDLRSRSKQATFALQSHMTQYMREYLYTKGFIEIHTPKLTGVSSEGGAEVFQTTYFGRPAYLAQSPQLYKQMAINGDFPKVFEIGPVFRAEKSNTKRHLTEFTGFDLEMRIEKSYEEVLDLFYDMLSTVFSKLYSVHSDLIFRARNSESFSLEIKKCVITYEEAIHLLNSCTPEGETPLEKFDDINHAQEHRLGQIVKNVYKTDMFVLDKFPTNLRPFYTLPCKDTPQYSNSYDIIFRGQEVLSGAQRIHSYQELVASAFAKGLTQESVNNMGFYFDSFKYGVFPHAGGGFGVERLIENFLDLDDIRMVSMFPRDPKRLEP